MRGVSFGNRY